MIKECTVEIPGGDITLEGTLSLPDGIAPFAGIVVCHPHSQYGGSMRNNVVDALATAALQSGLAALRFNFRGVGASTGIYDGGRGEQDDVRSALTFLRLQPKIDSLHVVLAGYSFGAAVAAPIAFGKDSDVEAFIAVSLPTAMTTPVAKGARPHSLFISGDSDEYSSPERLAEIAQSLGANAETKIVAGADHFWWGAELHVQSEVEAFLLRILNDRSG